jgi:hypothetical protein
MHTILRFDLISIILILSCLLLCQQLNGDDNTEFPSNPININLIGTLYYTDISTYANIKWSDRFFYNWKKAATLPTNYVFNKSDLYYYLHITDARIPFNSSAGKLLDLSFLSKIPGLKGLSFSGFMKLNDASMLTIPGNCSIEEIDLSQNMFITDNGMRILSLLTDLKFINLTDLYITDNSLELINKSKNIETIILDGCGQITDTGIMYLANASNLKYISVAHNNLISDKSLSCIIKTIEGLKIENMEKVKNICIDGIRVLIILNCPNISLDCIDNIKTLKEFHYNGPLTENHIKKIGALTNIQNLYLSNCSNIAEPIFSEILKNNNIKELELSGADITDSLFENANMQNIKRLYLKKCRKLKGGYFHRLGKYIEEIVLTGSDINDESLKDMPVYSNLTVLNLNDSRQITDQGIKYLVKQNKLNKLSFKKCPNITKEGIKQLQNELPKCYILFSE